VIATHHRKVAFDIWECAGLDVFDPGTVHAECHIVLGFAGDRAGMTADATAAVQKKPESGHELRRVTSSPVSSATLAAPHKAMSRLIPA